MALKSKIHLAAAPTMSSPVLDPASGNPLLTFPPPRTPRRPTRRRQHTKRCRWHHEDPRRCCPPTLGTQSSLRRISAKASHCEMVSVTGSALPLTAASPYSPDASPPAAPSDERDADPETPKAIDSRPGLPWVAAPKNPDLDRLQPASRQRPGTVTQGPPQCNPHLNTR